MKCSFCASPTCLLFYAFCSPPYSWSSTPEHQSPLRHKSSLLMKLLKKRKKWEHEAIIPSNVAADMQPSISAQLKLYLTREQRQRDLLKLGLSFPLISLLSLGSLSTTYLIFRQPCEVSCGVLMKSEDRDEKQEEEMCWRSLTSGHVELFPLDSRP